MNRTLNLEMANFPAFPSALASGAGHSPVIDVDIGDLCHHLFLNTHGGTVPNPNTVFQHYSPLITASTKLEFKHGALGTYKSARIGKSEEFGMAFCRWVLYTHCGITYFTHMDDILGKTAPAPHNNITVTRCQKGDAADLVCSDAAGTICLGEAKGSQSNGAFPDQNKLPVWRQQFTRVDVRDNQGNRFSPKGYIVATRMRTEKRPAVTESKMYVEDPPQSGELTQEARTTLRRIVITQHYASILEKLAMPLYAAALWNTFTVTEDITFPAGTWKCLVTPLQNRLFVGGLLFLTDEGEYSPWRAWRQNHPYYFDFNGWTPDLLAKRAVFFGVEEAIFRKTIAVVRRGLAAADQIPQLEIDSQPEQRQFGMTLLRDGTLLAPAAYLVLDDVVRF